MKFSVLMSIYQKCNPHYFEIALDSVMNQTLKPTEIVLVKDGPLTEELEKIISEYKINFPELFKIVPLEVNHGLGHALRTGIESCSYDIIARMDTDDIARQDRFEKQIDFLKNNPDIDIVGSFITEFEGTENNILTIRKLPEKHEIIYEFAKWRCPFNHMTVMYKKKAVLVAGNYGDRIRMQDYDLWVRMLNKGSKGANIPEYLVNVRAGDGMVSRNRGVDIIVNEIKLHKSFLDIGFINHIQFLRNITAKFLLRIMPFSIQKKIYYKTLREPIDKNFAENNIEKNKID